MTEPTVWWLLAGGAVALELATATFYLLMLAIGLAAGALAAHAGMGVATQMVAASLVGGGSVAAWHFLRERRPPEPQASANANVNLDIGETLHIESWNADGTASVHYRGAHWTAMHRPGVSPSAGVHRVAELIGSRLLVDKI